MKIILTLSLLLISTSLYAQQICNKFPNGTVSCQGYDDSGNYQGQTNYNRVGHTNQWQGTDMGDGPQDNNNDR